MAAGHPADHAASALRFIGKRALSLPVSAGRMLVEPGETVHGLAAMDRRSLLATGLFAPVDGTSW